MKIELKNIKHFYALTDETNAFSAKLYVNGVYTADCSDTGKGGCIDIRAVKGRETLLKQAGEYTKSLPPVKAGFDPELDMDLELYIGLLVETDIEDRELKKAIKKLEAQNIVFGKSRKEPEYTWFTTKGGKKVDISVMLSRADTQEMLAARVAKLQGEGNRIFNTNIPDEILNAAIADNKQGKNPK
ncbi:hypothetical protein IR083_18285 [Dysgonomonas sp. GY75]|uniref:hypothetical protein n=1 Tax=Dysgonomonas sp. GY75 TaxID=2780419 RepID=UPI0018847DC9|nr:hypothetical protein [Dysgonomonas sp. GY75]MBF0650774.1 hypothetical protein [Dysgonomonas sp. GY75]